MTVNLRNILQKIEQQVGSNLSYRTEYNPEEQTLLVFHYFDKTKEDYENVTLRIPRKSRYCATLSFFYNSRPYRFGRTLDLADSLHDFNQRLEVERILIQDNSPLNERIVVAAEIDCPDSDQESGLERDLSDAILALLSQ